MIDPVYKTLKRFFSLLFIVSLYQPCLHAQRNPESAGSKVVILKDGSKLKGKIVKTAPGEYLSVMLNGGQIIKIYQHDIRKIKLHNKSNTKTTFNEERGEIIILKDGGSLFGKIIDQVPDDYVILKLKNEEEVTFFTEEIAQIKYNKRPGTDFYDKQSGYYHETDVGILVGEEDVSLKNSVNFSVHTVNGYRFKPWLQTGLGVGLDFQPNLHIVPFYLNVSGDIGRSKVVPLYFMNVGYTYAEEREVDDVEVFHDAEGGKYLHFGGGVKIKLSKMAMFLKMGYKLSDVQTSSNFVDWLGRDTWDVTVDRQIRRFTVTLGFGF